MLSKMNDALMQLLARFRCEEGQALAEYSLILAFIFVACIVALGFLGLAIMGKLEQVGAGSSHVHGSEISFTYRRSV